MTGAVPALPGSGGGPGAPVPGGRDGRGQGDRSARRQAERTSALIRRLGESVEGPAGEGIGGPGEDIIEIETATSRRDRARDLKGTLTRFRVLRVGRRQRG